MWVSQGQPAPPYQELADVELADFRAGHLVEGGGQGRFIETEDSRFGTSTTIAG